MAGEGGAEGEEQQSILHDGSISAARNEKYVENIDFVMMCYPTLYTLPVYFYWGFPDFSYMNMLLINEVYSPLFRTSLRTHM